MPTADQLLATQQATQQQRVSSNQYNQSAWDILANYLLDEQDSQLAEILRAGLRDNIHEKQRKKLPLPIQEAYFAVRKAYPTGNINQLVNDRLALFRKAEQKIKAKRVFDALHQNRQGISRLAAAKLIAAATPDLAQDALHWLQQARTRLSDDALDFLLRGALNSPARGFGTKALGQPRVEAVLAELRLPIPKAATQHDLYLLLSGAYAVLPYLKTK